MASATYNDGGPVTSAVIETAPARDPAVKRISWSAILAGVVVAVAIQLLLSLLGAGIGLGLVNPVAGDTPGAGSFGLGASLWWLVSNLIALFIGGYVAAWLAGIRLRFDGMLHGIVTWGVTLLLTVYLLSSAVGGILSGASSMIGGAASAAGNGIKAAAPQVAAATGITPDQILDQAQGYLQSSNTDPATMSAQDAQKAIAAALPGLTRTGAPAAEARERIVTIMAAQLKISHDEAAKRFDDAQAQLSRTKDQAVQTAKVAADETAGAASKGSFLAFATLLLGAAAAAFGGAGATQRVTRRIERTAHVAS